MSTSATPFRLPRLQFSLRGLLLLMLLVGVGLVVYRWPWEVVDESRGEKVTTHYRRGWNGTPVKHGLEVKSGRHNPWVMNYSWQTWYDEGDLRRSLMFANGMEIAESHSLGGKLHGPSWSRLGGEYTRGEYRAGLKHGEWYSETGEYQLREQFQADQLHGPRVWTTRDGRVLLATEYEHGRLVKWNNRPVAAALQEWLTSNAVPQPIQKFLLTPIHTPADIASTREHPDEYFYHFPPSKQALLVCTTAQLPAAELKFDGRPFGVGLLEGSLERRHMIVYRYRTLSIVPISGQLLDWKDRTGVYDVRFAAASEQEQFWMREVEGVHYLETSPVARYQRIFATSGQSPIDVDRTALGNETGPEDRRRDRAISPADRANHIAPRARRDLFGQHLDRDGYYVEQDGNKLTIKRHRDNRRTK